jgi:phage gpG-like protein
MITGTILGDRELIARLNAMPARAKAKIDATVTALGFELERRVKTNYLRGPRPQRLGVKTGRLLASITRGGSESRTRFESTPDKAIYYVGTNVEYGAPWEYGFKMRVGAGARGGPRTITGKALATYFAKHPPGVKSVGARPFLHPALNDMKALITERLGMALRETAQEGLKP